MADKQASWFWADRDRVLNRWPFTKELDDWLLNDDNFKSRKGVTTANAEKRGNMKLELAILAGAESKAFLADLAKLVERMEKVVGGAPVKVANTSATVTTAAEVTDEDDDDFAAPAKKSTTKKAAAAAFDDDDDADTKEVKAVVVEDDDDTADFTTPPKKEKKAKKLTVDDCNDAAKARAGKTGGKEGRKQVLALMKKHFKTESVSELKPEQYEKFIEIMAE